MRYWIGLLFLLALGTLRMVGCGDASPCGDCSDGNPCTIDDCVFVVWSTGPDTGWRCDHDPVWDGTPCGSGCGSGDVCADGVCGENLCAGVVCDDGNPCTRDYCDYGNGNCRFDDNDLDFEPCPHESGRGICYGGVCGEDLCAGVVCDDGNLCTEDYCDLHIGCVYEPPDCYDQDDCTQDLCDPATGRCYFTTPSEDGTPCYRNDGHYTGRWHGVCEAGVCVGVCDPASVEERPCPIEGYEDWVCCPGWPGCIPLC